MQVPSTERTLRHEGFDVLAQRAAINHARQVEGFVLSFHQGSAPSSPDTMM